MSNRCAAPDVVNGGHQRKSVRFYSLYGLQYEYRWFICWLYEPECENFFRHFEHWNGFSPVCSRLCSVRWCLCLNAFGQSWHLYGRWPVVPFVTRTKKSRETARKREMGMEKIQNVSVKLSVNRLVHIHWHAIFITSKCYWPLITGQYIFPAIDNDSRKNWW